MRSLRISPKRWLSVACVVVALIGIIAASDYAQPLARLNFLPDSAH